MNGKLPTLVEHEEHFTDRQANDGDRELGDHLAYYIGDTFITCMEQSPVTQWVSIVHALRFHGLKIVEDDRK